MDRKAIIPDIVEVASIFVDEGQLTFASYCFLIRWSPMIVLGVAEMRLGLIKFSGGGWDKAFAGCFAWDAYFLGLSVSKKVQKRSCFLWFLHEN